MQDNVITTTLLHAILKNQHAIADALADVANWIENAEQLGRTSVVANVRESLRSVDENRAVIGRCISELMSRV